MVMKKEQKQILILIILICMGGLIFAKVIFRAKVPSGEFQPPLPFDAEVSIETAKVDFFELEEQLKTSRPQLKWVRDPFHFSPKKEIEKTDIGELNLTGIIYDKESPVAVINDIIVHEGEEIEGAMVLEIRSDSVVFEKDGKTYTLKLLEWEG